MDSNALLSSVLIPLTEKAGEVAQIGDLLGMLEHCFIDAFKMRLPAAVTSEDAAQATAGSSSSSSIDAGEEAKLLAVRAVTNFHRSGATTHRAFFQQREYHPHAALFILELLKSLSGNSQQWFRQLQLDSLEACLAIVEVIGIGNVRMCLPGVVSVGVRYVHRAHHGKDSSKVCLTALRLLRTALMLSFASAEPTNWVGDTVAHLTSSLRSILEPSALVRGAYGAPVTVALESLITSLLVSPVMADHLSSPLGALLAVAFAVVTNMDHLHHLGDDVVGGKEVGSPNTPDTRISHRAEEVQKLNAVMRSPFAMAAVQDALQYLRGVELLHVATTAVRLPVLSEHFFSSPVRTPPAAPAQALRTLDGSSTAEGTFIEVAGAPPSDNVTALFLSVVRKCVRVVGTELDDEALYTHRRPRKFPAGVVDEFLFSLAGTLARLPPASSSAAGAANGGEDETAGERLTNALLDEYNGILQDWDAYAVHPSVLYVLTRLVVWQFHPSLDAAARTAQRECDGDHFELQDDAAGCVYPSPSDFITSGAFEQLWSVVAPAHLWNITEDVDLCNNQQIHHRQVVAATLLRFLTLTAEVLSTKPSAHASEKGDDALQMTTDALERLFALTLYLVLEKATASGVVHEAAMRCLEMYSTASNESDALSFLLHHSSLIVDETARAVREEHLRPAASSVLRGSLAFLASRLMHRGSVSDAEQTGGSGGGEEGRFCGSSTQLTAVVRQRLSSTEMSAFFQRTGTQLASLQEVAQVSDFVGSTLHVARDTLFLCSRYDSSASAADLEGRRAALALLRDALDVAAYLNFSVPQEALDEDQERHTTSAHTRVRALQSAALEAVYAVLQYCTVSDAAAPLAVQSVVRGLTCFLTTSTAVAWAEKARQRLHDAAMARRNAKRKTAGAGGRRGHRFMEKILDDEDSKEAADEEEEEEDEDTEGRSPLPASPPLDWPWTHYVVNAAPDEAMSGPTSAAPVSIELPRSHLHTVYRVYLSFFALLREPVAAFATVAAGPGGRTGMERRKLADVSIAPAVFETLHGLESIRLLALDFLLHRMVSEVLPLVVLWHERGCLPRIPTHTDERLKAATQQFVARLFQDCKESPELQSSVSTQCCGYPMLSCVAGKVEGLATSAPEDSEGATSPLLVPPHTKTT
ncbi:hypothetical protein ABB37_07832 [Leptomonas pyrrhocoris]|uniref:Uncharacterized protein n=1 Tax=Leptomonas pyrrhocoris TaxID=157538 RepID=A0A0M9FUU4_LEPPY|nr:hypothetical protein ABB37_07832 [Leptomonas pyrrhocoris]KPA76540.1 hypothetical protein ABB37_07832 [Leptomonas pyrrhocoris]|eukprot:XP_015654979.1 hypothetical protein ABB37_07832 [Leptomonas pyrrhocoris]